MGGAVRAAPTRLMCNALLSHIASREATVSLSCQMRNGLRFDTAATEAQHRETMSKADWLKLMVGILSLRTSEKSCFGGHLSRGKFRRAAPTTQPRCAHHPLPTVRLTNRFRRLLPASLRSSQVRSLCPLDNLRAAQTCLGRSGTDRQHATVGIDLPPPSSLGVGASESDRPSVFWSPRRPKWASTKTTACRR